MASGAQQKRGKSRFAFTLPKPLTYMQLDNNYEHILAWARKEYPKKDAIRHISYNFDPRVSLQESAKAQWDRLVRDFDYSVDNARSIVIDTKTELDDLRKNAEYGRTSQIIQRNYGPMYSDYRWLVNRALASDCNVIFLHRMNDEWLNDERTGNYVLAGWKGIMYECQVYVEHERNADGTTFTTTVKECAQDAMLTGMELSSAEDENDFPTLATRIFPDSDRESWL